MKLSHIILALMLALTSASTFAWHHEYHRAHPGWHHRHHYAPPGWHHGEKVGWHGRAMPPGQVRKSIY